MKELSKKILSTLTAAAMIFTIFASPVGEIFGFVGETVKASAASYTADYRNWSQGASDVTNMRKYGCWVTAQAKMLQEAGMTPDGFNPDVYLKWQQDKGYINSGFYQTNGTKAPCEYAKSQGYELTHVETVSSNIKDKIWENINNGYYTILYVTYANSDGSTGTHYVMIANELSKENNEIWVYNSYSSSSNAKPTTLASKTSWTLKSVRSYKGTAIDLTKSPKDLGTQFVAPIKVTSTGKVLTAGSDGNVTVQTWTGADNQRWIFTKNSSDNYYEIRNGQYYQKVLDVANGSDKDGANLQIWEDNDTASQRFGIFGSQGNYIIKVKYSSGRVIDSDGGNSNVHMWTYYKDLAAQKFTISPEPTTRFDTFSATNITNNDARVKCKAYKRSEDKAVKYGVVYAPADTWNVTSTRKSFYSTASTTNVGSTYREIYFDFGSEIGDTLKPDTTYNYYFVAVYSMDGVNMTFSSSVQSFKTTNTCTHTFGSWTTKTSATCTADGLKQRTCSKCGKVESAVITKLGHSYTSSVTKAATCTATGVRTYKCSRCTSSYTESIAKTGHSYTTGYEAAHPHKNYKKCTTCGTYEYTGTTQYLYNCASCTNLTVPTITSITSPATINKAVTFSWTASTSDKLGHYWVTVYNPSGTVIVNTEVAKGTTSYSFTPAVTGDHKITIAATPTGSPDGTGSSWENKMITVHDIARYYEATHPHKYVDYCKNCDYMVYVGTNLGYYEKCKTCHDSVAPSKPVVKNVASSYVVGDSIIVKWDATTNTTHYNITLWKKDETGEYKSIEWVPYAENGHTFTGYGAGEYGISIQSYNSGYFYQYSETWRDWVHTSSSSVRFTIKPEGIKNFSVTSKTANTVTLGWTKNTTATGYIIQQMKNGTWTNIANISNNATTSYTVSGLAASTSYSFRAVAYATANGSNIYSSYTASTPAITLPASITGFAITGRDSSSLTLSWAKNTSADGYVIQQQVNGAWSNVAVLKSNATVTYKVTELDPNVFYRFRMVAFKSHDGTKLYSKYTGAMSGYTAPAVVSGLKVVTDSETQLTVSWSKVDSANGYVLDIYKDGKWTEVARYKSNATLKYVATGLTAGTQYKFRIKSYAVNNSLTIYSTYSSPVIAVTKPAQVTGFKITANGSNSVSLSWNKMNASGYVIQCLKNNEWVTVCNIKDGTVTSYTVTGLTANSSYKFRMVAYATVNNTSVYGKYTAALAGRTAPAKVTNLTMTNRGTDFISVRWDKDEKADGYMIYLYDGTKWTCIKTMTSNSAVSHKITGLASGKNYKITVKAFKTVDNVKCVSDSVTISATTI